MHEVDCTAYTHVRTWLRSSAFFPWLSHTAPSLSTDDCRLPSMHQSGEAVTRKHTHTHTHTHTQTQTKRVVCKLLQFNNTQQMNVIIKNNRLVYSHNNTIIELKVTGRGLMFKHSCMFYSQSSSSTKNAWYAQHLTALLTMHLVTWLTRLFGELARGCSV